MRNAHWLRTAALLLALTVGAATQASAQQQAAYPSRAIDIITGFAPGGTTDLVARMIAQYLGKKWNVPINVINKPGGNTVPANLEMYKASPDGYTLFADTIGSSSMLETEVRNLPFKVADRTFVAMISSNTMLIFVPPGSPLKTMKDVAEEAKRDPASFTWTGIGVASVPMRQFMKAIGVDILKTKPVVSTGSVGGGVLAAGSNVKVGIAAVGPSLSPVAAGLIRPVGIAGDKRWPTLPDVPTVIEQGYPTVRVTSWIGLTGPPNLPANVVEKWNVELQKMLADPDVVAQLTKMASIPDYKNSAAFREQVLKEMAEFADLWSIK